MKQVNKDAYEFARYAHPGRFVSYYHQLNETIKLSPKSVLEVGVGDGVFRDYIKNNTDIDYTCVDVANDLHPDVVGSVTALPFANGMFDVVCAFEVLEHLPFETFETAIKELKRVSRGQVIISLPHFGPPVKFLLKISFLPELSFAFKLPFPRKHIFNGQHHWEIGKKNFSAQAIRGILEKYFMVENEFVPFENQYHHFYILRCK